MAATEGGPPAPPAGPTTSTHARHAPSQPAVPRMAAIDPLSDKATILLIRRTLCPKDVIPSLGSSSSNSSSSTAAAAAAASPATTTAAPPDAKPIEDLLPPLTSRNDVDLQLYGLLAIVVREFVLTWYSKITPDDDQLVTEIVQIIAHCTRALEQRLRKVDLENLLFDEIPQLLDNHVRAYRASRTSMVGPCLSADNDNNTTRAAYHALWPLPALSPVPGSGAAAAAATAEQAANEAAYRQLLVSGLLAVLLPTEDLKNECLTSLVGQILSELLIGSVLAQRVAEPWMMWEIVGIVARLVRDKLDGDPAPKQAPAPPRRRRAAAKRQGTSAAAGAAGVAEAAAAAPPMTTTTEASNPNWLAATVSQVALSVLSAGFALFSVARFLVASFTLSRSLPPRGARSMGSIPRPTAADDSTSTSTSSKAEKASLLSSSSSEEPVVPVLSFSVWTAVCNLVQLQVRMPWLYGTLSMLSWLATSGPGRIAALNGPLDRLLSHYIHRFALDPALLPTLLRATRGAVFPGNKFGAAPPTLVEPATDQQLAALKRRVAETVYAVWGKDRKEAPSSVLNEIEGSLLDIFDDAYCNKHLLYSIVEAVFVRLVPELAETGTLDLWDQRLS